MSDKKQTGDGFGWDAKLDPAEAERKYPILPEGLAMFAVTKLERKRQEFGKFGVQNVAVVTAMVTTFVEEFDREKYAESAEVTIQLALVKQLQWKLLQFFTAIGQRKHGDKGIFAPDWSTVDQAVGRCKVAHRTFRKKDGSDAIANEIAEFLEPDDAQEDGNLQF